MRKRAFIAFTAMYVTLATVAWYASMWLERYMR